MRLEVRIGDRNRSVEFSYIGRRVLARVDGRPLDADAVEVSPGVYSILIGGHAFEVRVDPRPTGMRVFTGGQEFSAEVRDPRAWRRGRRTALEAEGRQQVNAPMTGKVIRVLVNEGDTVDSGQGLMVVEAMKMQNEIKSPKSGRVERLLVSEGQTVNAGDTLVVVA